MEAWFGVVWVRQAKSKTGLRPTQEGLKVSRTLRLPEDGTAWRAASTGEDAD